MALRACVKRAKLNGRSRHPLLALQPVPAIVLSAVETSARQHVPLRLLLIVLRYCVARDVEGRLSGAMIRLLALDRLRVAPLPQSLALQLALSLSENLHVEGEVKIDVVTGVAASGAV